MKVENLLNHCAAGTCSGVHGGDAIDEGAAEGRALAARPDGPAGMAVGGTRRQRRAEAGRAELQSGLLPFLERDLEPRLDTYLSEAQEEMYRKIKYNFSADVLKTPNISTQLTFSVGDNEVEDFR